MRTFRLPPHGPTVGPRLNVFTVFDRSIIKTNWRKINESPLKRAGLKVRRRAIHSIRRARYGKGSKNKGATYMRPSRPGRPPKSRARGHPLRRIYSVPLDLGTSVIVGPVGFGSPKPVPEVHEKGLAFRGLFPADLAVGNVYRISLDSKGRVIWRSKQGKFVKQKIKIRRTLRTAKYPPRPFMVPALQYCAPQFPRFWKNSLSP